MKLANPKLFKAVNYALLYFQVTNRVILKRTCFNIVNQIKVPCVFRTLSWTALRKPPWWNSAFSVLVSTVLICCFVTYSNNQLHLFSIKPGISFLGSVSVKLLEGEPEHLLEGSGIENQAPRFINQPARQLPVRPHQVSCTVQPAGQLAVRPHQVSCTVQPARQLAVRPHQVYCTVQPARQLAVRLHQVFCTVQPTRQLAVRPHQVSCTVQPARQLAVRPHQVSCTVQPARQLYAPTKYLVLFSPPGSWVLFSSSVGWVLFSPPGSWVLFSP